MRSIQRAEICWEVLEVDRLEWEDHVYRPELLPDFREDGGFFLDLLVPANTRYLAILVGPHESSDEDSTYLQVFYQGEVGAADLTTFDEDPTCAVWLSRHVRGGHVPYIEPEADDVLVYAVAYVEPPDFTWAELVREDVIAKWEDAETDDHHIPPELIMSYEVVL